MVFQDDVPFEDQAGIAGTPLGFEKMISIGARNSVTYVPAIAQRAVTSTTWVPGANPGPAEVVEPASTRRIRM